MKFSTTTTFLALFFIGLLQIVSVSSAPVPTSLVQRNDSGIALRDVVSPVAARVAQEDDTDDSSIEDATTDDTQLDARGRKHRNKKSSSKSSKKSSNTKKSAHSVSKKNHSGQGTFYNPGLGACGWHSKSHDMIAAISGSTWGGGSHCGKSASVCHGSRCINVQIVDMCPGCAPGSLDLSPAAFKGLASLDLGVVPITWHYN